MAEATMVEETMVEATTAADEVVEGVATAEGGTTGEITEGIMEEAVIMVEGVGATTEEIMEEEEAEGAAVTTEAIMEEAITGAEEVEVMKVGIMAAAVAREEEVVVVTAEGATDRLLRMLLLNSLRLPPQQ